MKKRLVSYYGPDSRIAEAVISLLFPRRCPVCERIVTPKGAYICPDCVKKLSFVKAPVCFKCGKEIGGGREYSRTVCGIREPLKGGSPS